MAAVEEIGLRMRKSAVRRYAVTALEMPIVFNEVRDVAVREKRWMGHHDHDGLIYALDENVPDLEALRTAFHARDPEARRPHPLVRPLVLRACRGETVRVSLTNRVRARKVGMHLVGGRYGASSDGAWIGRNAPSLADFGESVDYEWECPEEGAFCFHDLGDPGGDEASSNAHGLFGALIVEPPGAWFSDPEAGVEREVRDGLSVDVHLRPRRLLRDSHRRESLRGRPTAAFPGPDGDGGLTRSPKYPGDQESFREFVIFIHDEPDFVEPHTPPGEEVENPVPATRAGGTLHGGHGPHGGQSAHGGVIGHEADGSLMCINYRSEPMSIREPFIWKRLRDGILQRTVINEEQHHSSWMFGDCATPIFKAYVGDPIRIRLVHPGVKETHVFHLHLYSWHHDPDNRSSPLIDAISISPQTGHTIVPLFGAGNVQAVPGDVIWHCHLYPHFHMGMWGMLRSFDTLQTGRAGEPLAADGDESAYAGRRLGCYPDGTPIKPLAVLPDREPPPAPTPTRPGFPLFIPGQVAQKSPQPPWPLDEPMPPEFDYRPATALERRAFNSQPKPGEMFTRCPYPDRDLGFDWGSDDLTGGGGASEVDHEVVAARTRIDFNDDGWHDKDGHVYYLAAETPPETRGRRLEPLFFRCRHGEVLNVVLHNTLKPLERSAFDPALPPGPEILVDGKFPGECGLHVHMVKFDPLCADGASTGWNYMSAPSVGRKLVYRWWADEEFGTIFFHDHLFANLRQRHGLFGALIVEPRGATFHSNHDGASPVLSGRQAVIKRPDGSAFREICLGLGDWIAMYDGKSVPLEAPDPNTPLPSHDDNGTMCVNYRCAPLRERGRNPADWFSSKKHNDPDTDVFETWAGDPLRIRLVQGSHEEQHSFQINGMRWRRFWPDPRSPLQNQQTLGISEAFTFDIEPHGPGDHLWRCSSAEDTWLGCWGLIRAHDPDGRDDPRKGSAALRLAEGAPSRPQPPESVQMRRYRVVARRHRVVYRPRNGTREELADPLGLVYVATAMAAPGDPTLRALAQPSNRLEPLVLRCRQGEWVEIELSNELPDRLEPEPAAPELPVEPDARRRCVSSEISLHADLLTYYVREHDGANVGHNKPQTIAPGSGPTTLRWYVDPEIEPGAVLLQDFADVRNHRHHGLVGALVIEPRGATPYRSGTDGRLDKPRQEAWTGPTAVVRDDGRCVNETVLVLQDGLRYFANGVPSTEPNPPDVVRGTDLDTEDQGHKGFNYRSDRLDELFAGDGKPPSGARASLLGHEPVTPVFDVPAGAAVRLHLVVAADKPRNHSFTVHGHLWSEWPHHPGSKVHVSAEGALTTGCVRTYSFVAASEPGDYAYRSGVLKWALGQGLWGVMRVHRRRSALRDRVEHLVRRFSALAGRLRRAISSHEVIAAGVLALGLAGWARSRRRRRTLTRRSGRR